MEILEPRIRSARSKLDRLTNNPAPTVPIYNMIPSVPTIGKMLSVHDPSSDDFTAVLFDQFLLSHNDVWARCDYGYFGVPQSRYPLFVLGFTEWVNDKAYFGDWYLTGGGAVRSGDGADSPFAGAWNVSDVGGGSPTVNNVAPDATTIDLHMTWQDDSGVSGNSRWLIEAYGDGLLTWSKLATISGDSHQRTFHSIQAIVIPNNYGNFSGAPEPAETLLDNIIVGTSQGASDIMSVQDFEDGTFGTFTAYGGDAIFGPPLYMPVDSFAVVDDPL